MSTVPGVTAEPLKDVPDSVSPSVGGFVYLKDLEPPGAGNPDWNLKTKGCKTLSQYIDSVVTENKLADDVTKPPKMSAACACQNQASLAFGTGFLVHQNMIIATAGHVLMDRPKSDDSTKLRPFQLNGNLSEIRFIFGLTQEYATGDAKQKRISASRVWEIDRILFGQYELFDDVATDGIFALDAIDIPDWALVRLKAPAGPSAPVSLKVLPLWQSTSGRADDMISVGHTWGTPLKISDRGSFRTTIKAAEQITPAERLATPWKRPGDPGYDPNIGAKPKGRYLTSMRKPTDYDLVNIFLHNLRVAPGNSGGPIMAFYTSTATREVLGIQSSVKGIGFLEKNLHYKSNAQTIDPYFAPDEIGYYSSCTKYSLWSSLITPGAQLTVVARVRDDSRGKAKASDGKVSIKLNFTGQNEVNKSIELGPADGSDKSIRFEATVPAGTLTCELTSVTVSYVPPPNSDSKKIVFLELLQVVSRIQKPQNAPDNPYDWTPLVESKPAMRAFMTDSNGNMIPLTVNTEPYIPRQRIQNMVKGSESLPANVDWPNPFPRPATSSAPK